MSFGIKEVSKTRPCPICGKAEWCGFKPLNDGGEQLVCKRDTEKVNVIGHDGAFYVYVKESIGGNSIYEEAVQRQNRLELWRAEHGYKNTGNTDMQFKKSAIFSTPKKKGSRRNFTKISSRVR